MPILFPYVTIGALHHMKDPMWLVFLAVVHSLGKLPKSEMKEIQLFETLPEQLTYPYTSPKLYAQALTKLKQQ